jgi:integrase
MRQPAPYFRSFDGWWYVQLRVGGARRQIKLAKGEENRDAAVQRWHEIMAAPQPKRAPKSVSSDSVKALLDEFLDHCRSELSAATADWYDFFVQSFSGSIGDALSIDALQVSHVTTWLKAQTTWSKSTKSGAVQAIRRAFRWLSDEGRIRGYPLKGLKGTRKRQREVIVSPETFKQLLAASRPGFRDLLTFLLSTGCRPQEARAVERRHVDLALRRIVFPASEAKGGEHPRVIYLTDEALAIVKPLCERYESGPIFRNSKGKAWTRNAIRCRFRRLREKVGSFCAYHLRHTYATEALKRLDPITVSVLMGHSDPTTLARTYQHLAKDPVHMLEVARRARPAGA